ncbi:MAG: hypothetical protein Q9M35_08815 [Rhodothermus sp.]|nr:hypothetical protein [Rhodothermus sp.]
MRKTFLLIGLVVLLGVTVPAQAQLRTEVSSAVQRAPMRLYRPGTGFSLSDLFSPKYFRMQHSYEVSMGSLGGYSYSLGVYTNSMRWQFSDKLAARVDIGIAHTPFGGSLGLKRRPQLFLRNAEIAYRPRENMLFQFTVRQSPYGYFMAPYGYYRLHALERALFWNDR